MAPGSARGRGVDHSKVSVTSDHRSRSSRSCTTFWYTTYPTAATAARSRSFFIGPPRGREWA